MIELLILYSLKDREKTIYALRKSILEKFGAFTKPSYGTIFPALKRLLTKNFVNVRGKISEGGRKSTYYEVTKSGLEGFSQFFLADWTQNPSLFHNEVQARFATLSMLNDADKAVFFERLTQKIELYQLEIKEKFDDEYINFDIFQQELLLKTLTELKGLNDFIQRLKTIK